LPSIDQQRKIGEVARLADVAIATTTAVIAKLKQVRIGLIQDLLSRGVDDNGELRDPIRHPEQFEDRALGKTPKSWTCLPLLEATAWYSGGTPSRSETSWWTGPIPFLTPKDMKRFALADTIEHLTPIAVASGSRLMDAETVFIVNPGAKRGHAPLE
jgi:type I restriction enzyme S subunit